MGLHTKVQHRERGRCRAIAALLTLLIVSTPLGDSFSDDAASGPFGLRIGITNGQPQLRWSSVDGQRYTVEVRTNLIQGAWSNAADVDSLGLTTTWTDMAPLAESRFYRVSYAVAEITAPVSFTHLSESNGIPELATASFPTVRDQLLRMVNAGKVVLPMPMRNLDLFDSLVLSDSAIWVDDLQRTIVVFGRTLLRSRPVDLMFVGTWGNNTNAATGFSLGVGFSPFDLTDWISGLSGTVLDDLALNRVVVSLATAPLSLNLSQLPGNVAGFYGGADLNVQPGLNLYCQTELADAPRLAQPLQWLGFTDTTVLIEGFLGVDPNALFHLTAPSPALLLRLRAHLPVSQPAGFPEWLRPRERILEFSNNPALRARLLDILEASPDGQITTFRGSTEIDTTGGQMSVTLSAALAQPWERPFGISWLEFQDADLQITFSREGAGEVLLEGKFAAGDQNVTTEVTLTETANTKSASFVATVDRINLGDVLELFSNLAGSAPFGDNLPDDTLVLSNAVFSFNSSDERSVTVSATSTIRDAIRADVLLSFVEPEPDTSLLVLALRVHNFKLSAVYSGINGTVAGDLEFPGVAFTLTQEVPDPQPIEISSDDLDPSALQFYESILGKPPYVLELKAGMNFSGTFPQSRLPRLVLDVLGMDPAGKVLLEGALDLRLGALAGGDLVSLDSLELKATLPPPARARAGLPEWLANLQPGARTLAFNYVDPDIKVKITDEFQVDLDGASRTFITSATLATHGQQAAITITGDMAGGWAKPFGVDWLTLDTVGITISSDGVTATVALRSSFELGNKNIALEMAISGGASNQLVRFSGTVDMLSLSDFLDLARNHVGADAQPFGNSTFDFTFSDVYLSIETGTRSSFSLGGETSLNGTPAQIIFSVIPSPGGGLPQIITGFLLRNWSLADALDPLKGTFVEDFRFDTVGVLFSKGEGTTHSADMDLQTRAFYSNIYGTNNFSVPFRTGLSLIGVVPLNGNPLQGGLDALGMSTDAIFLIGTVPGSIIGLGGGGGLSGLSLLAGLPPVSPPGAPEWFLSGQLGLEITAQPSVGFVGSITVDVKDEILTFDVSAAIQRVGVSVEFALTGGLSTQDPWVEPFGIEWLIFNNATVKVAVSAIGSITLGFAGDMIIGEKDIDVAVAVRVSPAGVPTNFIFDGASNEGVSMMDLVILQQRMARVNNPNAPMIPLDALPNLALRGIHLKFAPQGDPDLGVEAGFAIEGALWIPSELNGPPDRNFASTTNRVDLNGILAQGQLGSFELGPIIWSNAICDLTLTLPSQHLFVSGAAKVGSFFEGNLGLGITRTGLSFVTTTTVFGQFQAQLDAQASFSLSNPQFTVHGLLQNDFGGMIVPTLTQKLKTRANASTQVANDMLRRALAGWTAFRNDPHSLNFANRVSNFASTAGWPQGEWSSYINAIQDAMEDIDNGSPGTPANLLDLALGGHTTPGIPGVKTTICVRRRLVPPFDCLETQDLCNGVPYSGGACWTVAPRTIGGACHDPDLAAYNIPCSSTPFIEQKLIPPLTSRIDTILANADRLPMIVIEQAEFTANLNGIVSSPIVTLATRMKFMQAATPLNLSSTWNFNDRDASLDAMRDALTNAL